MKLRNTYYLDFYNTLINMISDYTFLIIDKVVSYDIDSISESDYNINEIKLQNMLCSMLPSKYIKYQTSEFANDFESLIIAPMKLASNSCGYDYIITTFKLSFDRLKNQGRYKDVEMTIAWIYKLIQGIDYVERASLALTLKEFLI